MHTPKIGGMGGEGKEESHLDGRTLWAFLEEIAGRGRKGIKSCYNRCSLPQGTSRAAATALRAACSRLTINDYKHIPMLPKLF